MSNFFSALAQIGGGVLVVMGVLFGIAVLFAPDEDATPATHSENTEPILLLSDRLQKDDYFIQYAYNTNTGVCFEFVGRSDRSVVVASQVVDCTPKVMTHLGQSPDEDKPKEASLTF